MTLLYLAIYLAVCVGLGCALGEGIYRIVEYRARRRLP